MRPETADTVDSPRSSTWQEDQDGALVMLRINVRHQVLQQVIVDARLIHPCQVAARRRAVVLVQVRVVLPVQWRRTQVVITPPTLDEALLRG